MIYYLEEEKDKKFCIVDTIFSEMVEKTKLPLNTVLEYIDAIDTEINIDKVDKNFIEIYNKTKSDFRGFVKNFYTDDRYFIIETSLKGFVFVNEFMMKKEDLLFIEADFPYFWSLHVVLFGIERFWDAETSYKKYGLSMYSPVIDSRYKGGEYPEKLQRHYKHTYIKMMEFIREKFASLENFLTIPDVIETLVS